MSLPEMIEDSFSRCDLDLQHVNTFIYLIFKRNY